MRSSKLNDIDREILQRYVPKYDMNPPSVSEKSVAVFLSVLYQNDLSIVAKNMSNPVYKKYYKYYLTIQKIVAMVYATNTVGILQYNYIVDIYTLLFDIDRNSLDCSNEQYDYMIEDACTDMDCIIEGSSRKCDIVIVSDILYRFMKMQISGNIYMDYIVGYIVVNYLLIYLGYRVIVPMYEVDDIINSIAIPDIDCRIVKTLIGKKILYGLDYVNDIVYCRM